MVNVLNHYEDDPQIAAFIAGLPADPERDRLVAEFRQRVAVHVRIGDRLAALSARKDTLTTQLADTDGESWDGLLAEYVAITGALDSLPRLRQAVAHRVAHSLVSYMRRVRGQILAEHERRARAAITVREELAPTRELFARAKRRASFNAEQQAKIDELTHELARLDPYEARMNAAKALLSRFDAVTSEHFGGRQVPGHLEVDHFVRRVADRAA